MAIAMTTLKAVIIAQDEGTQTVDETPCLNHDPALSQKKAVNIVAYTGISTSHALEGLEFFCRF